MFELIAGLLVLTAAAAYVNHRYFKLPDAIGVMAFALVFSVGIVAVGRFVPEWQAAVRSFVIRLEFRDTVLHGMLAFLLFAGGLHVHFGDLRQTARPVVILAIVGTFLSTILIGLMTWWVLRRLEIEIDLISALLFGAVISPTDPIAVLEIIRRTKISKRLETMIVGESLLNDGVAIVIFLTLLQLKASPGPVTIGSAALLFLRETIGGIAFGAATGYFAYRLFKTAENHRVEILISLALACGTFAAAEALHLSAPLAVVVAGVLTGNPARSRAMSAETVARLDGFWEAVDDILNSLLFVLIGLELVTFDLTPRYFVAGLAAIVIVLAGRFASVSLPGSVLRGRKIFDDGTVAILTWGALRGGLSVAMALSLPTASTPGEEGIRDAIVVMTWIVATFSILVQGLTVGKLARRWSRSPEATAT